MRKKLQVFVSSTYIDLKDERQAAVEAILSAGHIPAGMELFKAGSDSQLVTIKRWIDESDVYMLILGGRYGSIDEKSGKSYTQLEYEYAVEKGMPVFSIVIKQSALENKVKEATNYLDVTEQHNPDKLKLFREEVLNRMSAFFEDLKDIKLATLDSLNEIIHTKSELSGWVSGREITSPDDFAKSLAVLSEENSGLIRELEATKAKLLKLEKEREQLFNGLTFDEVTSALKNKKITLPKDVFSLNEDRTIECFAGYLVFRESFSTGISNTLGMNDQDNFLFYRLAPNLLNLGLLERVKLSGTQAVRIQTSKLGNTFLALCDVRAAKKNKVKKGNDLA